MDHKGDGYMSRREVSDGTSSWHDYRTAHNRAGDTDYKTFLPETCETCHQQEASVSEEGVKIMKPDEEWTLDGD